jgi:hypothetical protein
MFGLLTINKDMSIIYTGAIASSVINRKKKNVSKKPSSVDDSKDNTNKEQNLKWIEEGKCQCCGAESGEYEGICDECRFS